MSRLRVVLVAPRIAANVGNVARSCLAMGAELILVGPLGFKTDEASLRRYSVGYWEELQPRLFRDSAEFWEKTQITSETGIFWATKRGDEELYNIEFPADSLLIFGNEEEGVDESFWNFKGLPKIVACRIPTVKVRCLNLSVSVGVLGFEVLRQWRANRGLNERVEASQV